MMTCESSCLKQWKGNNCNEPEALNFLLQNIKKNPNFWKIHRKK